MGLTLRVQCTNAARRRHRGLSAQSEFVERRPDSGVDVEHSDRRDVGGGWPLLSHQLDQRTQSISPRGRFTLTRRDAS